MPFPDQGESLKTKAHLTGVKLPVVVGVTALVVAILVCAGILLIQFVSSDGFAVTKSEDAEVEASDDVASDIDDKKATIVVHVGGAVASPGIQELIDGARVQDAIDAAGGFAASAARDALNLARVLVDGEQIVVPTEEEIENNTSAGVTSDSDATGTSSGAESTNSTAMVGGRVNINTASSTELESLPGIGPATAAKIISDREANGPFKATEDIKRVSGIGDKKYAALADLITVG